MDTLQLLHQELVRNIVTTLEKRRLPEPAFCVALAYLEANCDAFPIALGIGLQSELDFGDQPFSAWSLWQPANFAEYPIDIVESPVTHSFTDIVNGFLCDQDRPEMIVSRFLNAVSQDLMTQDWKNIMPTTADFVVYAVPVEGNPSQLEINFRASISLETLADLEAKRRLWFAVGNPT